MRPEEMIVTMFGIIGVFGLPFSVLWMQHKRKMLELQLRMHTQGDANVTAQLEAMRQELRQLRDTTMQYDLSFDTALQRMESRIETLERRAVTGETDSVNELRVGR